MPQLDVTSYSSQIFWLIICLTFLFVSLRYLFIPRLENRLKNRQRRLEKLILEAQKMTVEAELLNAKHAEAIKNAHIEGTVIHKQAIAEFEKKSALQLAEAAQQQETKLQEIRSEITEAKKQFYKEASEISETLMQEYVAKAISTSSSVKQKRKKND